ncbi:hypothetical protein ZWY2020_029285 [Hordeum vulgare]|nr:hypothetical protein ZWY2020_029285 [Hordeum vulgare]
MGLAPCAPSTAITSSCSELRACLGSYTKSPLALCPRRGRWRRAGGGPTRILGVVRAFLLLFVLLLAADIAAHAQGSHLAALLDLDVIEGRLFAAGNAAWIRARTIQTITSTLPSISAHACEVFVRMPPRSIRRFVRDDDADEWASV